MTDGLIIAMSGAGGTDLMLNQPGIFGKGGYNTDQGRLSRRHVVRCLLDGLQKKVRDRISGPAIGPVAREL